MTTKARLHCREVMTPHAWGLGGLAINILAAIAVCVSDTDPCVSRSNKGSLVELEGNLHQWREGDSQCSCCCAAESLTYVKDVRWVCRRREGEGLLEVGGPN